MAMLEARTLSLSIRRPWQDLYEEFWPPEQFPRWASGLSRAGLRPDGETWVAQGPEGPVRIRFTPRNAFGVMDHTVWPAAGPAVLVPLRILPNGAGAEAMLTLFRQPGMDDARFAADAEWVLRDLQALRALAEG